MLIIEEGKVQLVERRKIDCREWLTVLTVAGELFEIEKPDVSEERLAQLREMARAVLDENRTGVLFCCYRSHAEFDHSYGFAYTRR